MKQNKEAILLKFDKMIKITDRKKYMNNSEG